MNATRKCVTDDVSEIRTLSEQHSITNLQHAEKSPKKCDELASTTEHGKMSEQKPARLQTKAYASLPLRVIIIQYFHNCRTKLENKNKEIGHPTRQ